MDNIGKSLVEESSLTMVDIYISFHVFLFKLAYPDKNFFHILQLIYCESATKTILYLFSPQLLYQKNLHLKFFRPTILNCFRYRL